MVNLVLKTNVKETGDENSENKSLKWQKLVAVLPEDVSDGDHKIEHDVAVGFRDSVEVVIETISDVLHRAKNGDPH